MIIGVIVYVILAALEAGPIAEARAFGSIVECEQSIQRGQSRAEEAGVRILFSKCLQEN